MGEWAPGEGRGLDGARWVCRHRQGGRGIAGRADRRGRRRPDDSHADLAVLGKTERRHLQRPGRRGGDAAGRRGGAPAQGHRQPAPGRLDDARFCADGVLRRLPAAAARQRFRRPEARRDRPGGAAAMVVRFLLDRRSGQARTGQVAEVTIRPVPTVLIGMAGGVIVGLTSVGSGSLMIILLLFAYPMLSAGQLVGTDLTQAVPLTAAAALGALAFGHVEFGVTASIIVGSVPAVLIGSLLSSRAPDRLIRPVITFVILASGLKYVGLGTAALGWTMGAVLLAAAGYWFIWMRPARAAQRAPQPVPQPAAEPPSEPAEPVDPVEDLKVR